MADSVPGYRVAVIGGGPAGLAAAAAAAGKLGAGRVALVDDNVAPGGQIWRRGRREPLPAARRAEEAARTAGALFETGVTMVDARALPGGGFVLLGERAGAAFALRADRLVLATGATERFLPFPGWTLPGVYGAGGLQALYKSGFEIAGKRILVAGSGPLLLAVAQAFRKAGAKVPAIVEQAPRLAVLRFAARLPRHPQKLFQALGLGLSLLPVRQLYGAWPVRAEGDGKLERVVVSRPGKGGKLRAETFACDYLACGFGLVPSLPLTRLLGCAVEQGRLAAGELLETSVPGIFAAGESLGIGGLARAEIDGRIAGLAAAGAAEEARLLLPQRRAEENFATALAAAYQLREELRDLVDDKTVVCRCEDVAWGEIRRCPAGRDAKLKTRAGMGPCQGRICGGALEFLAGHQADLARPPLFPISCGTFAELSRLAAELQEPPTETTHPGRKS
jgi:NADPH-dependent 2,4-dienoyl-CoA reductase/sulfur reductase-like enzyme